MRLRLQRRAASATDVEPTMEKLKQYGYLDDKRFAESFATARKENQGLGRSRVARDLRQRRVAPTVAEKAISDAYQGADEVEMIEQWLERKYRNRNLPELLKDEKNLASAFRRLRYAGFSHGNSIRVLKRYAERADELEDSDPAAESTE
ncbi:MAG TPA: regulatory protein RecX [Bryobacteraceae bacterium]|nr:regulatory protein RecX [Bryobacteraceae bacterium]